MQTLKEIAEIYIKDLDNQSPIVSTSHRTLYQIRKLLTESEYSRFEQIVDETLKNRGY